MEDWHDISTAPKNPPGEGVGPWILVFSDWDHGRYQARWECRGDTVGWKFLGRKSGPWSAAVSVRAWMTLPEMPAKAILYPPQIPGEQS